MAEQTNKTAKSATHTASARETAANAVSSVRERLPEATTRNVAIGAAAAAAAVGIGVAATVGRGRITKASGDLVAGVKKRVYASRSHGNGNAAHA